MAARFRYRCETCGATLPAERVEKRVPTSGGMARVMPSIVCERDNSIMVREDYTPPRREVRSD